VPYGKAGAGESLQVPRWVEIGSGALVTSLAVIGLLQHPSPVHAGAAAAIVAVLALSAFVRSPAYAGLCMALVIAATFVLIGRNDSLAVFILIWMCGAAASIGTWRASVATLLVCAAGLLTFAFTGQPISRWGWVPWTIGCGVAWAAGRILQSQQRLVTQLQAAYAALAEQAANEERQRIAREIHDVIAHSLTVTMLHVTAARLALDDDVLEARTALTEAERLGRQSLADIRRTVGLLRPRGDQDVAIQPLPAAADVPTLVEDFRRTGLAVDFRVEGDLGAVSATTGLALYRIVQESLTNAAKHAPGAAVGVEMEVASDRVHVVVLNPRTDPMAPASDEGFGTVGMEQRATLLGGTLRAGPDGDGWSVEAELPCGASTAAPSPG
jgi:signal transduction histidine kinase